MTTSERPTDLEIVAQAIGLRVWSWDVIKRSLHAEATSTDDAPPSIRSLEEWLAAVDPEDQDRCRQWFLALGHPTSLRETIYHTDDGARRRLVAAKRDGTRFVVADQQASEGEKIARRSLQDFLYAVSHDLHEPLRMISSYSEILERKLGDELPTRAREPMAFVQDGAHRLRGMLHALLELSRVETRGNAFEDVDLNLQLQEICADLELASEDAGASIEIEDLPSVAGDETQLFRLFHALVDNALKFHGQEPPEIVVTGERLAHAVRVVVADRGILVNEADAERIFRPFGQLHARDKYPGLGTGLPLARRIAERHGGSLDLEADPTGWNRFVVVLAAG